MNATFDIILFAVIALVLLWRLRSVLGERAEGDPPPISIQFKIETVPADDAAQSGMNHPFSSGPLTPESWGNMLPNFEWVETATAHHQMAPFFAVDPSFHPADFLPRARTAFSMVVDAFSRGDKNTLQFMLAPDLYDTFAATIDTRNGNGETRTVQVDAIKKTVISRAALNGTRATLTVDFIADQTVTRTVGNIVDAPKRDTTHDRWCFERDLATADPVWKVTRTEDLDG
jgi:predicted lipid-binding transport protein (Tim44 family)